MKRAETPSPGILARLTWRNLWRNYRRTLIMLAAIVLGVWAMILFSAMMRGMLVEMVHAGLRVLPGEAQIHHPLYQDDPSVANSIAMPEGELRAALETNADDHQSRLDLATALAATGENQAAVDELLELFRRDREWNDGAAKAQLFTIFEALKPNDPVVLAGRRKLSSMIFL